MATQIRLFEIATTAVTDLDDNEICNETTADADLGWKMWAGKGDDSATTKWLAKDQNAQVADLNVTGDITVVGGTVSADSMANAALSALQVVFGDFSQASTFKWESSKLRIGSTASPAYMVDIESTSADQMRLENSNTDDSAPTHVFYKDSASPADNDPVLKIIGRGKDGNQSTPGDRDFITITGTSPDVSAVTGRLQINILGVGLFDFASTGFIIPVEIVPATLADASAANNSIYYSSTQSKLVYKDIGGGINELY